MRKTLVILVLALAIPSAALAAQPQHPTKGSKAAPKVTYVLKGTLWNYTAATTITSGSITIDVTHSNYHGRLLKGMDLTFATSAKTATTLNGGTISSGARGIVKFREFKNMSNSTLMTALTATTPMTASQIIAR